MSTQVDPQPQDGQRTETVTAAPGSEDEAIQAFNQRRQSQAQAEPETPTDEPQDDEEQPEADADPVTEPEAEALVEVEYEGEKYELPPKLREALLRKADYSRNMGELSAAKKDYAQRKEAVDRLTEGAEEKAAVIAEGKTLDAQLKQFETIDWQKLETDDPARASLLAVKFLQLQQSRTSVDSKASALDSRMAGERQKLIQSEQAEMLKVLAKDFPGWGDEAGERVTKYARKSGYSDEDIRNFSDPRLVLVLEKARKFDAIQDGKKEAVNKAREAQPVAKPGAPRRPNPTNDAMVRFQKSTSPEDAVAVFMAQAAAKQR